MKLLTKSLRMTAVAGLAAVMSVSAMAGIANTKHNLGSTGSSNTNNNFTANTGEICVFCHTPHGGKSDAPLWNRALSSASDYTAYTSTTMDGSAVLSGSPSLACLSCHDGQQAMDTMINAPSVAGGAYNYNAGGSDQGWTFTQQGSAAGNAGGFLVTSPVPNLTQDLSDDHPVAIPFAGGGLSSGASAADLADPDFNMPSEGFIGGQTVWWLNTTAGGTTGREKQDIILYTRDLNSVPTGFVECASCHDPHTESQQFLRPGSNNGSQVCLACHDK